jgi:hypothetical protein
MLFTWSASKARTTLGWSRRPTIFISRWNRASTRSLLAISGAMIFSATLRSIIRWCAL